MKTAIRDARQRATSERNKAMRDPVAQPVCAVCKFDYPPIIHMHHVHPLAETKEPVDRTVWLCPNCHAMVHEIRRVYLSAKRPSNYRVRVSHLDYWLSELCSPEVAEKLIGIARSATL